MYGSPYYGGAVAYAPADVRADFIRKVYQLLFVSLLVTVGVGAFCAQPSVALAILGMFPVFLIGGIVCGFGMAFARRSQGLSLALLMLYSAIQGAIFGPILVMLEHYAPGIPMEAAVLTVATFGGLSIYVWQSRKDFSYLGGMLTFGLIGLLVAGFLFFFLGQSHVLSLLYSVAGVVIFGGYVLYDTSMILNKLGPDEAVFGAISLYLDFINLFWFILRLLMELNRRN